MASSLPLTHLQVPRRYRSLPFLRLFAVWHRRPLLTSLSSTKRTTRFYARPGAKLLARSPRRDFSGSLRHLRGSVAKVSAISSISSLWVQVFKPSSIWAGFLPYVSLPHRPLTYRKCIRGWEIMSNQRYRRPSTSPRLRAMWSPTTKKLPRTRARRCSVYLLNTQPMWRIKQGLPAYRRLLSTGIRIAR